MNRNGYNTEELKKKKVIVEMTLVRKVEGFGSGGSMTLLCETFPRSCPGYSARQSVLSPLRIFSFHCITRGDCDK